MTEYVALLGAAVLAGALGRPRRPSCWCCPPSTSAPSAPSTLPVDYDLRWPVMGSVLGVVLLVVLTIAFWISRRTVQLGTPSTLRQADGR